MLQVTLEGTKSLQNQLRAMSRAAQRSTVRKAARAGARLIVRDARRRAPRSKKPRHPKGHAYKTIKAAVVDAWPDRVVMAIGPTDWGWYLGLHETGTSRFAAQPYLRPALDAQRRQVVDDMGVVFREAVLQAAQRARGRK